MIPSLLHYLSGNISADGTFYEVKDLPGTRQLYCINGFINGEKKRKRCKKVLQKYERMKRLTSFLLITMDFEDQTYGRQLFYEAVFKFGNITNERVNELYQETIPNLLPAIEI